MNAIRLQRIHQAYLFTGSRGIGKTSIARIFAKVLRCENTKWVGEQIRSCDECSSCKEVTTSTSVDVIEIDGASNNGVEAVREIRENAKYMPASGSRKIYIIDEVHMLTTAAFNALLKTLEEPPAHVIFIFATTEPHKIPATILSRCQRFDFRRITVAQTLPHLQEVTKAEDIQAEPGALALIARAAEGSMRDALSLLDQVIAFSGNQITAQTVRESIGLIEGQTLLGIVAALFGRKPIDALALVDQAYQRGHDLRVLTRSLIEFLHAAVLAKIGAPSSATLELSEDEWKELATISGQRSLEEIELIFQVLHHGMEWIARSPQPKVVLDVLLVKCATAETLVYASEAGAGSAEAKPAAAAARPTATSAKVSTGPAQTAPAQAAPAPAQTAATMQTIAPAQAASASQATSAQAPAQTMASQTAVLQATPAQTAPKPSAASNPTWEGLIDHVRKSRPLLASILEHGSCGMIPTAQDSSLVICFAPDAAYFREQLGSRVYHEQIITLSKEYFGRHVRIQLDIKDAVESLAAKKERESKEREQAAKNAAMNHPIIMEAKSLFGGELGPIEVNQNAQT